MDTELNAVVYKFNAINYTEEFKRVLRGVYACYSFMLRDDVSVPSNNENEIRNILLCDYLNDDAIRNKTDLIWYSFNKEVPEEDGRVDIKVEIRNPFVSTKAYYIIECKRLNNKNTTGTSGLNAEYINNGMYRFVSRTYPTNCRVNAMIGFVVEQMDIHLNIQNINVLLKNPKIRNCNTTQEIQSATFIPNFKFHYSSIHDDCENNSFTLYHLMFDFSENIKLC
ncbi:MAG: hypothetical protein LBQ73_10630 [Tannerellaceae bacterium]|jgi:hypothetical protein|nr:hypothetical protein [Tannerellaceae bacterium]